MPNILSWTVLVSVLSAARLRLANVGFAHCGNRITRNCRKSPTVIAGVCASLLLGSNAYGIDQSANRVVVSITGHFSSIPETIVDGDPTTFPLPSLLGGSFAGSFEYQTNSLRTGFLDFPFSGTSIDVFDNAGMLVHSIELPTSGEGANPFKVGNGSAIFYLGPSFHTQSGHIPETPTLVAFDLVSSAFSLTSPNPPSAADLNSASVGNLFGYGPFVELDDDVDPFYTWDLPIVSLSFHAREVPEPSVALVFFTAVMTPCFQRLASRRRTR